MYVTQDKIAFLYSLIEQGYQVFYRKNQITTVNYFFSGVRTLIMNVPLT